MLSVKCASGYSILNSPKFHISIPARAGAGDPNNLLPLTPLRRHRRLKDASGVTSSNLIPHYSVAPPDSDAS